MNFRKRAFSVLLVSGLLSVFALMPAMQIGAKPLAAATVNPHGPHSSLVKPFMFTGCYHCTSCQYHTSITGHVMEPGSEYRGGHDWCAALPTCSGHPDCGVEGEGEVPCGGDEPDCGGAPVPLAAVTSQSRNAAATALARQALDGDDKAAQILVTEYRDIAHLDAKASAIWIAGCDPSNISALVPVTPEFVTAALGQHR